MSFKDHFSRQSASYSRYRPEMLRLERDNLLVVLEKTGWKIKGADGAAELLGVKPTTLLSRIKKMGLRREEKAMSRQAAA